MSFIIFSPIQKSAQAFLHSHAFATQNASRLSICSSPLRTTMTLSPESFSAWICRLYNRVFSLEFQRYRFPEGHFDEESTELIYQTMIFHLKMMDEFYVEKKLYGSNAYDDNYEVGCRSIEDRKRIYSVMRQNKNAFMKLFSLFYYDLWD